MRRKNNALCVLLLLTFFMIGCGKEVDAEDTASNVSAGQTITENASDIQENTIDECPEGYVYDYQVSMEPIPEEIAALGGPCQGTIHAFPSKIGMALTELEMEKDPLLKAEVEKRIPEIIAALETEIGGEFVVDGVILKDALSWVFFCTEVETGYQFDLYYANQEYFAQMNERKPIDNVISVNDYYREKESVELREELLPLIKEIYSSGTIKIQKQCGLELIDIVIAQYSDEVVDKCIEQKRVLKLWEILQEYNGDAYYNLSLTFYPPEYESVIEEKFSSALGYDFSRTLNETIVQCLGNNKEIQCCLRYVELSSKNGVINLDTLLQQYTEGKYNEEVIWEYWIQ